MPCVIPVASSSRNSALRNRSKRRGERTEPCTVPVSSCMGAEHPKAKSVYSVLKDFNSFEEWYRSELRGRMVQTLMEVRIQSLHVMSQDTDMHYEKAVRDMMVLFRLLDGNVRAEVEHHNIRF